MGAIVLCSHIVLYLIVLCTCLSIGIEQCVLWSNRFVYLLVSGCAFCYSFVFMTFLALVFLVTSQLIINELGFGSGALWLSGCRSFLLSFLHLRISDRTGSLGTPCI